MIYTGRYSTEGIVPTTEMATNLGDQNPEKNNADSKDPAGNQSKMDKGQGIDLQHEKYKPAQIVIDALESVVGETRFKVSRQVLEQLELTYGYLCEFQDGSKEVSRRGFLKLNYEQCVRSMGTAFEVRLEKASLSESIALWNKKAFDEIPFYHFLAACFYGFDDATLHALAVGTLGVSVMAQNQIRLLEAVEGSNSKF